MDWKEYWDKKRAEEGAPPPQQPAHRKRKSWNDYSGCGMYHIATVERASVLPPLADGWRQARLQHSV